MADFSISGSFNPREILDGLKAVERSAETSGQRLGENLLKGVSRVGAELPSSLSRALRSVESLAGKSGTTIGSDLAAGINKQVSTAIPTALSKALGSANATRSGEQLGSQLAGGVTKQVGSTIPSALSKALSSGGTAASKAGQGLGSQLSTGLSGQVSTTIPTVLGRALTSSGSSGAATKAGQQLGGGVASGVDQQVSKTIPTALNRAISNSGTGAGSSGQKIGQALSTGIGGQLQSGVPSSLTRALQSGGSQAGSTGQQIGNTFTGAIGSSVRTQIPSALSAALSNGAASGGKAGRDLGTTLSGGANESLGRLLPSGMSRAVGQAGEAVKGSGAQIGSGLGSTIGTGLGSSLPPQFKRVFAAGSEQAGRDGQQIGQTLGRSIGSGLDSNKALFASVISQAQKAARDVGLVFNAVKLRFETVQGEIVPQRELDKLRALNPAVNAAVSSLQQLGVSTREGAAGLKPLGDGMERGARQGGLMEAAVGGLAFSLANTLTNAAGAALNAVQGTIGAFAALDTEIRRAATAAGEEGGYERLYKSVELVGIEAAGTQQEVAALATSLVRAGYTVSEVEKAMPGIVRGAEATGTAFEQMGSIVGNTLRGFGLDVKETARVTDVLVKTANASNASVEGLGYTFQYAAPVAKSLKISLEDLAAAAGLMANAGIDASVAGTGLRFGLGRLQKAASGASGEALGLSKGSKQLAQAMRILGAEVTKADGTLRPLDDVFVALKRSLDKLDTAAQIEMASAIFGDEAGSKFLAVTNQSEAAIRKMFGTVRNAKGATDEARGGMQGFQMAINALTGTMGALANTVGQVVAAALTPFISAANTVLGVVVALPGPIKQLVVAVGLLVGAYAAARIGVELFRRALAQSVVTEAIGGITELAGFLRGKFLGDVAAATIQWNVLRQSLSTGVGAGAVQGLQQIAQGLKALNAQQVIAGFTQLGTTIRTVAGQGRLALVDLAAKGVQGLRAGLAGASVAVFDLALNLKGLAGNSRQAEAGLSGASLALQRGMTGGATGAANAAAGLSGVLNGLANVTGGSLVKGIQAFAGATVIANPIVAALAVAAAAAAGAIISYNDIIGESGKLSKSAWAEVDRGAESLRKAGIQFQDLGLKGGPAQEAVTGVSRAWDGLINRLRDIPVIGDAVRSALQWMKDTGAWAGPIGTLVVGVKNLAAAYQQMRLEAIQTQGVLDNQDAYRQWVTGADAAVDRARKLIEGLKNISPEAAKSNVAIQQVFTSSRQALSDTVVQSENLRAKFVELANAAKAAGSKETAEMYMVLADGAKAAGMQAQAYLKVLEQQGKISGLVVEKLNQQAASIANLTEKIRLLNAAAAGSENQLQIGQKLLDFGKAQLDLEQSRFAIVRARGDFELQQSQQYWQSRIDQAQKAGASERKIDELRKAADLDAQQRKARSQQLEAQALSARLQGLKQEQQLQQLMLTLSQEKARIEASSQVLEAKKKLAELEQIMLLNKKQSTDEEKKAFAEALAQYAPQKQLVELAQGKLDLLGRIQPIERLIAQATNETAVNNLRAEAASKGLERSVTGLSQGLGSSASNSSDLTTALSAAGVQLVRAADGSVRLQQGTQQAAQATTAATETAKKLTGELSSAANQGQAVSRGTRDAATATQNAATAAANTSKNLTTSATAANSVAGGMKGTETAANKAATAAGEIGTNTKDSANKTKPLLQSLTDSAKAAVGVATAKMASNLSGASGSAGGLRKAMQDTAAAAQNFFNWLLKASNLPGSRWTGGPVEGGSSYRINELGQEAFMSSTGRLSLISKPANSLWTAPSSGVVIPAGVTDQLKQRGAFAAGGAAVSGRQLLRSSAAHRGDVSANLARQAVAIGKLQQSVDRLVEKDWNVQVRVRNDANGAAYLNTLNRMR